MSRRAHCAVVVLAVCAAAACAGETPSKPDAPVLEKAEARVPVPPAAALQESEKQLRDVFKDDYQKKSAADRSDLAKRLLKLAQESKNDGLTYFVALREARDIAAAGGDIETAFAAIDIMAWSFVVEAGDLKVAALLTASRSATTPEAAEKVLDVGMGLLSTLAEQAQFDAALKLLSPLEDMARRANNAEAARTLQSRAKEVRAEQTEWQKVKPHVDKLKANPDDADAAAAVARYYACSKADWEHALPLFAKCSAAALKEAAAKDLAQPEESAARADVGDLWWAQSEKEAGSARNAMRNRALDWYNQALEGLAGVRKLQIEKRIQSAASGAGMSADGLRAIGLVFWVNPNVEPSGKARDLISSAPGTNVGAVPVVADAGIKALKFAESSYVSYPASEAVKAIKTCGSAFVWIKPDKPLEPYTNALFRGTAPSPQVGKGYADFSLFFHGQRLMMWFNWPENTWPGVEGKTSFWSKKPLPLGKWTMCGATWDGTTVTVYVNGERDGAYKSTLTPIKRAGAEIVAVGCDPAGTPEYFNGLIHSAMIFSRALSDPEVKQIHLMSGLQGK